ncbi:oxygen-dependent coproporphyrinogen oxidase [Rhabdobacter roseus]|uniref:coproporphyrinogen oxidase n=1 Tax=Rhabdobacter roseus TaxID=1655419 RepID=A0A840TU49_9BACT|nr:oxygen-dependent coproporphyrinogen oxidase [Rhabdobacter roseus]MBB5283568.1 coproporphyrinogen III oxidase [Rhabdobacter roseus]
MDALTIEAYFKKLQDTICRALEAEDGIGTFREDAWTHHSGGGGRTRLIQNGAVIEKGGVNFSGVRGEVHPRLRQQMALADTDDVHFFATGVSIVMHPHSPRVPIIHMNVRYFELSNGTCWFGGGIDLTPHYVVEQDARWFHAQLKAACDRHHPDYYPQFKTWADDYFFIPHRQETRGVGGIFFDYLKPATPDNPAQPTKEALFAFVQEVGESFAPTYTQLMQKYRDEPYGEREKNWQYLRRGRYVEFNLVWDRGTKFGLETNGRTESILMSLPPQAQWAYDHQPEPHSPEADTLAWLRKGVAWA